ncbi:EF-hand calcium-binding domain-containing protein 12-like [Glandiceps talaboti]
MMDEWEDFGLQRLFNPDNTEYLPLEDQIKLYTERNLERPRLFRIASKIWGAPRNRKRVIIAPAMEKVERPRRQDGVLSGIDDPQHRQRNTTSENTEPIGIKDKAAVDMNMNEPFGEKGKQRLEQQKLDKKRTTYSAWLQERKCLRQQFNKLNDCTFHWLSTKPSKSPIEQKYFRGQIQKADKESSSAQKYTEDEYNDDDISISDDISSVSSLTSTEEQQTGVGMESRPGTSVTFQTPTIKQPSPAAMAAIAQLIYNRRIRMIELFMQADKNKDWKVNRFEFRTCIGEAGIAMSDRELDDFMRVLGADIGEELDYRKFVYAMNDFKEEQRALANLHEQENYDSYSRETSAGILRLGSSKGASRESSALSHYMSREPSVVSFARDDRLGTPDMEVNDVQDSNVLTVPIVDLSEQIEMYPDDLITKKKQERIFNKFAGMSLQKKQSLMSGEPRRIYTGDSAVDDFAKFSTLEGDIGESANKYREDHVSEFRRVLVTCKEQDAKVDVRMLEKGILFPGDKPISEVQKQLRQPGNLFTNRTGRHFARHSRHLMAMQHKAMKKREKLPKIKKEN